MPAWTTTNTRPPAVEPSSLLQSAQEIPPGAIESKTNEVTVGHGDADGGCTPREIGEGPGQLSYLRYQLASLKGQCETLSQHLGATLQKTHQQDASLARCIGLVNQLAPTIVDFQRNVSRPWMYQSNT